MFPDEIIATRNTALCNYLKQNNIKIPEELAKQIITYIALTLLEKGDLSNALTVLNEAEKKNLLDDHLKKLKDKIITLETLNIRLDDVIKNVTELLNIAFKENRIDDNLLEELGKSINELKNVFNKAKSIGLQLNEEPLLYAEDIYKIMKTVKEELPVVTEIGKLAQDFKEAIMKLQQVDSVESFSSLLSSLNKFSGEATKTLQKINEAYRELGKLSLNTSEAVEIRDQLLDKMLIAESIARIINIISGNSYLLGVWLSVVNNWIKKAYENPSESPFKNGGVEKLFAEKIADIVKQIREMKVEVGQVIVPPEAPDDIKKFIEGLKQVANAIGDSILITLRSMKYYTTFNDYRWNGVWEKAEKKAGVDWGKITKEDVQKYEFDHCDVNGCYVKKRSGATGWLAEHMPGFIVSGWTTLEDVINNIEMYNKWTMNYGKNPLVQALGYVGYVGASIISSVASLFAPRMLATQLTVLKNLLGEWGKAIKDMSGSELRQAVSETWNMFFGSKERVLATIGALLLAFAVGKLTIRGLPKGARLPLKRAILGQLAQGDIIGAGLVVVERMLPMARLRGVARALIENGAIKASKIIDDAGIMKKVISKAGKISRIKTLVNINRIHDIVNRALKDADNLKQARSNLEKIIRSEGLSKLNKMITEYRTAKTLVLSNLESMRVHAPTRINKLKNALRKIVGKEAPVEELPLAVKKELEHVKAVDKLKDVVGEISAENEVQLMKKLSRKNVIDPSHVKTINALDEIIESLKKAGKKDVAKAFEIVKDNYGKLAGELERLSDLGRTLDDLFTIREMAMKENLWKEVVELSKRKKMPGKGWLRRVKMNLDEHLLEMRNKISKTIEERRNMLQELNSKIRKVKNKLEITGQINISKLIDDLAKAFEKDGFTELARELRKIQAKGEKLPLSTRIGMMIKDLGRSLGERIQDLRERYESSIDESIAESDKRFESSGLPSFLAKPYLAGLKVAEKIGQLIERIGDTLERYGMKKTIGYESKMIRELANVLKREYGSASLENMAFLKGLKKGLEGFEHTPIGSLLSDLDRSITEIIEAEEKQLTHELNNAKVREEAVKRLRYLLSSEGKFGKVLNDLIKTYDDLIIKMNKELETVLEKSPSAREFLEEVQYYMELNKDKTPNEIIAEAKKYAKENGIELSDDFWKAFEEYIDVKYSREKLYRLKQALDEGGTITLDEVQKAIDNIARTSIDVAWKSDWALISSYLTELLGDLESLKEIARRGGYSELVRKIEETTDSIRQIEKMKLREGGFSRIIRTIELDKTYSQIVDNLEEMYNILKKGLGESKVKGLRKLIDELKKEFVQGRFNEDILKKIKWEIRKIKMKNLPKAIRMELDRIRMRLGELASRLLKGKEAGAIEKALNELSDVIKEIEEGTPPIEKGWVGIDRIIEVAKANFIKVPKEFAEKVARLLSSKKKEWKIKTREGYEVNVSREIEIKGDGTLHIKYELEFPGNRRVIYDELVKADETGRIYTYKRTWHDPELEKPLLAYEEYKRGLRGLDNEAILGRNIEEILTENLSEIDPDYEVLSKIAVFKNGVPQPVISGIAQAGLDVLSKIVPSVFFGVDEEALKEKELELTKTLPESIFEEIENIIREIGMGISIPPSQEVILGFTEPYLRNMSYLYNTLVDPELLFDEDYLEKIERVIGLKIIGGAHPSNAFKQSIMVTEPENIDLDKLDIYILLPEPGEAIIPFFKKPDVIITLRTPNGTKITLPGLIINDKLNLILPPFYINLPDNLNKELETSFEKETIRQGHLERQELKQKQVTTVESSVASSGSGTGSIGPAPLPPIPSIPWLAKGKTGEKYSELEKLNI